MKIKVVLVQFRPVEWPPPGSPTANPAEPDQEEQECRERYRFPTSSVVHPSQPRTGRHAWCAKPVDSTEGNHLGGGGGEDAN